MSAKRFARDIEEVKHDQEDTMEQERSLDSGEPGRKRKTVSSANYRKLRASLLRMAEQQEALVSQLSSTKEEIQMLKMQKESGYTADEEEKEQDTSLVTSMDTDKTDELITTWKDIKQFNGCVESLIKAPLIAIRTEMHPFHIIRKVASVCNTLDTSEQFKTDIQKQLAYKCLWTQLKGAVDTGLSELMEEVQPAPTAKLQIVTKITVLLLGEAPTRSDLLSKLQAMKMSSRDSLESWKNTLAQLRLTLKKVYPEHAPLEQDIATQFEEGLEKSMLEYAKAENLRFTAATLNGTYIKAVDELKSSRYTVWLESRKRNALLPSGGLAAAAQREDRKCNFCDRVGHLEADCRTKQRAAADVKSKRESEGGFRTGRGGFRGGFRGRGGPPNRGRGGYGFSNRQRDFRNNRSEQRSGGDRERREYSRPPRQENKSDTYRHPQEGDLCHRCGKAGHRMRDCKSTYHVSGAKIMGRGAWRGPHQAPAKGFAAAAEKTKDEDKPKN